MCDSCDLQAGTDGVEEGQESDLWGGVAEGFNTATGRVPHRERGVTIKCDFQERVLNPATCFNSKLGDQFVSD